jgi:hypothetical protein
VVEPAAEGSRLLARHSGSATSGLLGAAFHRAVFEPLHFAMERRMLEGIRGLAEGRPLSSLRDASLLSLWLLAAGALVASAVQVVLARSWRRRLFSFVAAGVVFQVLTFVQPAPSLGAVLVLATLALGWWPLKPSTRVVPEQPESAGAAHVDG